MITAEIQNYRTENERLLIYDGAACVTNVRVVESVMMAQTSRGIQLCAVYEEGGERHSLIADVDMLDTWPWSGEPDGDDDYEIEVVDGVGSEDEDEEYRIQDDEAPRNAKRIVVTFDKEG